MDYYGYTFLRESDLKHYGLKGMHWGTRRWQNADGTFNAAGKQRYFSRGTGEDYRPVGRSAGGGPKAGGTSSTSGGPTSQKSFDKEKAKQIAKGVAIGAAVVGGTVLVAYGAKTLKDSDVIGKMRAGQLANAKALEQYKTEKLQIKLEGKEMRENLKNGFQERAASVKTDSPKTLAENVGDAVGKATTKGIQATGNVAKKAYQAATSEQAKQAYKNTAKTVGETAKKAYQAATSEKAVEGYKKAAQATGNVAKKAYQAATSEQAKQAYKTAGKTVVKAAKGTKTAVKTAASITKSTVEVAKIASQHPQETKAAMDYTAQLLKNLQGISSANAINSQVVGRSNATEQYNAQALTRQYRREHPNTKLSTSQIMQNFGYGM